MCEFKRFYIFYRVKSLQKIRWFTTDGLRQFKRNGRRYINLKLYGRSKSTVVESKAIREKSLLPSFFRASFNPTNILRKTLKSLTHSDSDFSSTFVQNPQASNSDLSSNFSFDSPSLWFHLRYDFNLQFFFSDFTFKLQICASSPTFKLRFRSLVSPWFNLFLKFV
jgi:hypothetical protein